MINSILLKGLSFDSLLTVIPGLSDIIFEQGSIEQFEKGWILGKKGDKLNGLYIPIDNDLVLDDGSEKLFLLKGRSLALKNLLFDLPLNYEVQVESSTKVLFLKSEIFHRHLDAHSKIKNYLRFYTSSLAVRNFKRFLEQFSNNEENLKNIISQVSLLKFTDIDDLNDKKKNKIIFIGRGFLCIESTNKADGNILKLHEGAWFGTEAITPPYELSYKIVDVENALLYALDLDLIKKLNLNFEAIQKIEDEPYIKLGQQENDQYLNDQDIGNPIGEKISSSQVSKDLPNLNLNLDRLVSANGVFESFGASIRNFSKFFPNEINIANLNSVLRGHLPSLSLNTILTILNDNGFVSRGFQLDQEKKYFTFPTLMIHQTRLILFFSEKNNFYYGLDPVHGYFKIHKNDLYLLHSHDEFIEANVVFEKNEKNKDQEKYQRKGEELNSWAQAKELFTKRKNIWLKITLTSILIFLINIIPPFISQEIVDEVVSIRDKISLITYAIGLIFCYFSISALKLYRGRLTTEFSYLFDFDFSSLFYHKILQLRANFFGDNRVGEVFARIGELMQIRDFFSGATVNTIINLITACIYSLILLFYSWKIAVIPIAAIIVIAFIQFFIKKFLRKKYLELFGVDKKTQSQLSEMINSISTVKAFMSERALLNNYEDNFLEGVRLRRDLYLLSSFMNVLVQIFSHIVRVAAIWVGVLLIFKSELTPGELFSINMFISRVLTPLTSLVEFITDLEEVQVSLKKLDDVFGFDFSKINPKNVMGAKLKGRINLDRVSFRYDNESPDILKDIDLTIYSKQIVAIVGESGCGKTTLANLIAGNLFPSKGKIYLDGIDQKFISRSSIKSQIGFIQQSNDLFAGTIESNVTYAHTYTNEVQMDHALTIGHCHEFIHRFPTGLKQYLAEGGMGLSGGQKQRLSIARTLYNNPKILILDEATSALDSESEAVLIDNMKKLAQGKTTILIAHRLSTIRHVDQIFVMDKGRLVESGSHNDLVQKRGAYYELFKEQMR